MPEAIRRTAGDELHLIAGADYDDGDVVNLSGLAGVVEGPVLSGDVMNVRVKGGYDVQSASATTFSAGAKVEFDNSTKLAVAAAAGDFTLGIAAKAKVSGETVVRVLLNEETVAPS